MNRASKGTRKHWQQWKKEYFKVLGKANRKKTLITHFNRHIRDYLLEDNKWMYLDLDITVHNRELFELLTKFLKTIQGISDIPESDANSCSLIKISKLGENFFILDHPS